MTTSSDRPASLLAAEEAALLELYRRMRRGQKDMLRELAELMVNRDVPRHPSAARTTRPPEVMG